MQGLVQPTSSDDGFLRASSDPKEKTDENGSHCQPVFKPEEWITRAQAARIRGVSRQAIGKLVSKGKLQKLEIGGNNFVRLEDVRGFKAEPGGRPTKK